MMVSVDTFPKKNNKKQETVEQVTTNGRNIDPWVSPPTNQALLALDLNLADGSESTL